MASMRCFIAIDLPDHVHRRMASLQSTLKPYDWPVRWTNPQQIHLTIKFLGDVPDADMSDICTALKEVTQMVPPFALTIGSAGCFPPRGEPRVIWTAVLDPPQPLMDLQEGIEASMEALGIAREARAFRPHLTLGRAKGHGFKGNLREILKEQEHFNAGLFDVEEAVMYQSELTPQGPIYTAIAHARLSGSSQR
jgi:2'-5' RNA ligase